MAYLSFLHSVKNELGNKTPKQKLENLIETLNFKKVKIENRIGKITNHSLKKSLRLELKILNLEIKRAEEHKAAMFD